MNVNSHDIHLVVNVSYTCPVLLPFCSTLNFGMVLVSCFCFCFCFLAFEDFLSSFSCFPAQLYTYGLLLHLTQHIYVFRAQGQLLLAPRFALLRVISVKMSFIPSFIHVTILNPYEVSGTMQVIWNEINMSDTNVISQETYNLGKAANSRAAGLVLGTGLYKREQEQNILSH